MLRLRLGAVLSIGLCWAMVEALRGGHHPGLRGGHDTCSSLALFGHTTPDVQPSCAKNVRARSITIHAPSDPDTSHSGSTQLAESASYDIEIFTDRTFHLAASSQADCKIAVLWEPPAILPSMYADFAHNTTLQSSFNKIFTFDHTLLVANQSLFSRYLEPVSWVAHHHDRDSTWKQRWMQQSHLGDMMMPEDARFAESVSGKSQGVSIILSSKTDTVGHRLRHDAWRMLSRKGADAVTGCGKGAGRYVADKAECLSAFQFTVVIENDRDQGYYFSEKIVDAFLTATVPIVWGDGTYLRRMFDTQGIMFWETLDELEAIMDYLSHEQHRQRSYTDRLPALRCNYFKALPFTSSLVDRLKAYVVAEDGSVNCNACPL